MFYPQSGKNKCFTLIELLIVVAIIAILAAIAVPNFLEAQVRAKVSRSQADMRSIDTAMQSYLVDYTRLPKAQYQVTGPNQYSSWWGFTSQLLTTPVAYITALPIDPFTDKTLLWAWEKLNPDRNNEQNRPYFYIRHTRLPANWVPGEIITHEGVEYETSEEFVNMARRSGYILASPGPDNIMTTIFKGAVYYDATNGTKSAGDLYRFGAGEPNQNFYLN